MIRLFSQKINLLFLIIFFGLFFTTKTVSAYWDYIEFFWNNPVSYDVINNPKVYQRGGTLTFSGIIRLFACQNSWTNIELHFYIETINGGIKEYTEIGNTIKTGVGGNDVSFNDNLVIPANAYIGLNRIKISGYYETWYDELQAHESIILERQIRVSAPPTTPVVSIYPSSPSSSDNLTCFVNTTSTTTDPYNSCSNPYVCPPYDVSPITYTYKWYKDSVLQSVLTKPDTTDLTYMISPTKSFGQVWKCEVIPLSRAGLLLRNRWPSGEPAGGSTDWTTMQGTPGSYQVTIQ